ncbi:DNA-directed RNA polymerase V subunit 1-like [Magnolia sinica]|uniref:DNA-directed RNA polymerase V subunit 1-like n=1 Tax=Magnolia sinica TaxID=86752 RepID=UPI00265AA699|nr:DNA-directed RNA polymerase V subunit 1-like [Magnolia sinica]
MDCVHIFYPQSLAAKAEVLELFSVEKQIRSSHSGSLNLQLVHDSLLSLKLMFRTFFLNKATAQQLAMCVSPVLSEPALFKAHRIGPLWTVLQIVQSALPMFFDCFGERHLISKSEMPLLMEILFLEGYSVGLNDFDIPKAVTEDIKKKIQDISPLLLHLRSNYNELVELQVESYLKTVKLPIVTRILKLSASGNLIDSKNDSAISKVVQQLGFLGLQLYDRRKFYSRSLVDENSPGSSLAGEPVGVLAATAVSNPVYKAVLDSSQSNNSSWESMKEILLCKVNFKKNQ